MTARFIKVVLALGLWALGTGPGFAQVGQTNFASFSSLAGGTMAWANGASYGGTSTDGALFTAASPGPLTPALVAAVPIAFTWAAAGINNSPATFEFRAFANGSPAVLGGAPTFTANQFGIGGNFLLLGPLGQIWLSGAFTNGFIATNIGATSSLFLVNSIPGGLVITSGTFQNLLPAGFFLTITKTGIPLPGVQAVPGQSLSSFDPAFSGVFAGPAVPEPAGWALLAAGIGLVTLRAGGRKRRSAQGLW